MDGSPWSDPQTSGSLILLASTETSTQYGLEPATREHVSVLGVLRRRAWIIVLVTLLAGGAAAAFAYATRNTYDSTSKVLFRQSLGAELNALGLLPGTYDADNLALDNVQVVSSRHVADATATRLQALGEDVSGTDVEKDVTVALAKNTDVVDVTAKAEDRGDAARLATIYAEEATKFANDADKAQARKVLDNLQSQYDALPAPQKELPRGRKLQEHIQRLTAVADVGSGSAAHHPGGCPADRAQRQPARDDLAGRAVRDAARWRIGARARAVRPQAAAHRAGHGRIRRAGADDRPARPGAEAQQAVRTSFRRRWPRRSGCCR